MRIRDPKHFEGWKNVGRLILTYRMALLVGKSFGAWGSVSSCDFLFEISVNRF